MGESLNVDACVLIFFSVGTVLSSAGNRNLVQNKLMTPFVASHWNCESRNTPWYRPEVLSNSEVIQNGWLNIFI